MSSVWFIGEVATMTAVGEGQRSAAPAAGADGLVAWAEKSGHNRPGGLEQGGLRFVFYGRVSMEDWQDPVTSRARQRGQAEALVRGCGVIVALVAMEDHRRWPQGHRGH